MSRMRPLYAETGERYGSFLFTGGLDESFGYNSNLLGLTPSVGNWLLETSSHLNVSSDWSRNRVGASLSVDNQRFFDQPQTSFTNFTVAAGGGYTIGLNELTFAYAHINQHQLPTEIGAPATSTPVPFTVDDIRSYYSWDLGRIKITPNIEYSFLRYGDTTAMGVPLSQSFRNRNVLEGGVTGQYEFAKERNLLIVAQGFNTDFVQTSIGQPSQSSNSALVLGGMDYLYNGIWRYRLLVGVEAREFQSPQFKSRVAAVGLGQVVWTPTDLLTLTGTASRTIEDPNQEATSGFTYSSIGIVADYEYSRNILLRGTVSVNFASELQNGGTQRSYSGGVQATWLLSRNMSVSASYNHTTQNGSVVTNPTGPTNANLLPTGSFDQNVFLVTLHFRI